MIDPVGATDIEFPNTPHTLQSRWEEQVKRWSRSGLSKSAYCKSTSINYHQMIYWSRKLGTAGVANTKKRDNSSKDLKGGGFVAVSVAPATSALFIRLPNGIEIGGIQEQRLPHVIDLVSR